MAHTKLEYDDDFVLLYLGVDDFEFNGIRASVGYHGTDRRIPVLCV